MDQARWGKNEVKENSGQWLRYRKGRWYGEERWVVVLGRRCVNIDPTTIKPINGHVHTRI